MSNQIHRNLNLVLIKKIFDRIYVVIEIFRKEPDKFDIVVPDQTMPHMTGYDLAKKLMEIRADIPIILCTGFSETVSPEKAKALGIKEHTFFI